MSELYLPLRHIHITCAILSITLFLLRGALMLAESPWQSNVVLRYLPHAVDTVLLTTALILTTVIHQFPFATGWLTAKLLLLVAYIVLGSIALKRGRTRGIRIAAFIAALATVGFLVTVARAHHPLGMFASNYSTARPRAATVAGCRTRPTCSPRFAGTTCSPASRQRRCSDC